jgi:two-component system, cell cycle response regulator
LDLLQREITRARRSEDGGMTIVLGDVDHFEKVNDTYGHATGDAVLRAVASRIDESVVTTPSVAMAGKNFSSC